MKVVSTNAGVQPFGASLIIESRVFLYSTLPLTFSSFCHYYIPALSAFPLESFSGWGNKLLQITCRLRSFIFCNLSLKKRLWWSPIYK